MAKAEFKKISKMIADLTAVLEETIEKRTEFFDNKSEKWQESEKGEEYSNKTDTLQEILDELLYKYDELNEEE